MADTAVAITAGTGTNIDTRTEGTNGNHRQVVVIGDPATNAGVAPVDATNGLAVDVKASALPSGAGTSAKQDTIIGHLDGVEGLLTTIDGDTGNISTKIDTIAGAVAGTEMQVDIVAALPAGTNAIGKLAANSGVDIGDTDVTSVIPGTGATNLGKAVDTATGATDTGVLALATRDDALSALTPIEGDNVQLRTTSTGALWVTQSGTVTVDGSGVTQPVSNAGLTELAAAINSSKVDVNIVSSDVATGGTSALDDADFTAGTTPGTPAQGVYESTPTAVTDGDLGTVGITSARRLKTSATVDAALPAGTNNIGDVDIASIAAGDNNIGNVDVVTMPTVAVTGTFWQATQPVSGTVDLGATDNAVLDAIAASTAAIDTDATTIIGHLDGVEGLLTTIDGDTGNIATSTAAATTALQIMDDWDNAASDGASVSGDVAHDTADAGEPVKIGMKAYSPDGTTPGTAVAENDRSNAKSDLDGRLFVNNRSPQQKHKHLNGTSAYTDEAIAASPGAGFQTVITSIIVSTGAATAMNFFLEEGGTTIFGPIYLEATAGRGFVSGPIYLPVTAATAVTITTSVAIAQSVDIDYFVQAV